MDTARSAAAFRVDAQWHSFIADVRKSETALEMSVTRG